MLEPIQYASMNLSLLADLADDIIDCIAENHENNKLLDRFLDDLEKTTDELREHLDIAAKSDIIQAVSDADQDRDDAYSSLRDHLKAGMKRLNDHYSGASMYLYQIFINNDLNLHRFKYEEQTIALENLLRDLNTPASQVHLKVMHAKEWVEELEESQKRFLEVFEKRTQIEGKKQSMSRSEAMEKIKESISKTLNTMEVVAFQENESKAKRTIAALNKYIKATNAKVGA